MKTLYKSYAKLNLNLYVGPPQIGGLHHLCSVFQTISLHDDVTITPAKTTHSVQFNGLDVPKDNTCTQVLDLLQDRLSQYWHIKIDKHIPAGAGLGGGSSNAATLLMALNELESLNLTIDEMATIASQVGSDVPFFLHGGQAQVSGTGDRIKPNISLIDAIYFVLILPNIHCSTASVYKTLDDKGHFDDLDQLNLTDLAVIGFNRLFQPACSVASELFGLYKKINTFFPNQVFMSGSGSTLFIPCHSTKVQADVKQLLETKLDLFDGQVIVVNAVN